MVHGSVGQGDPDGYHVEDVDTGRNLRLVSSRIDDDAFFLGAGVDVTICFPGPYDNSFYHGIFQRKGLRVLYQYSL
jgi:hypothetical protein